MTEVLLFTQEICGVCTTQREKNEGTADAYPGVEFHEVDIQTDLETAIEDTDQQSTGFAQRLASIVRR